MPRDPEAKRRGQLENGFASRTLLFGNFINVSLSWAQVDNRRFGKHGKRGWVSKDARSAWASRTKQELERHGKREDADREGYFSLEGSQRVLGGYPLESDFGRGRRAELGEKGGQGDPSSERGRRVIDRGGKARNSDNVLVL